MNTITYNPFTHMSNGVKKLLATNFWQIVVLYIVTTILTVAGMIAAFPVFFDAFDGGDSPGITSIIFGVGLFLVAILISSSVTLAMNRLVLEGIRTKKLSASDAFKFGLSRFGLYVALIFAALGVIALTSILTALLPVVGIIVMLALIVALVIYIPALLCLSFVIVEDSKPAGIKDAVKLAITTAKNATGQIWVFIGVLFLLSIVISAITGGNSTPTDLNSTEVFVGSGFRGLIGTLLNLAFGVAATFGLAELYNQAAKAKPTSKPPVQE
jgi:hypothetical protein